MSVISVKVVRICQYKKRAIGSSVWYDFKNSCSTPARKEDWSLATVNGSFTET